MEEGCGHTITLTTRELPFCLVCRLQYDYSIQVQFVSAIPQDRAYFRSLFTILLNMPNNSLTDTGSKRILIVDDEVDIANFIKLALEHAEFIADISNGPVKSSSGYKLVYMI